MLSRLAATAPRTCAAASVARRGLASTPANSSITGTTGQTGIATAVGLGAVYAISNEILILNAETVVVGCMAAMTTLLVKQAGPSIAAALDARSDAIEAELSVARDTHIASLKAQIAEEKLLPGYLEAAPVLADLRSEVNAMQREIRFREAAQENVNKFNSELDFYVQLEHENKQAEKDILISQVVAGVLADAASMEAAILKQCVTDLEALAAKQ